ncbi:cytochrome aa3 quinol oxidase subunit III [Aneurinibacillus aneurinilyticus]|jgi:cytochrome aa3-600 menaquinol oxidase subunit 3|uniref:Quinol oxidase subunit 3 n=2 Tax=Aneurinibacillus aneurinilyticus TaxID=1391 RepID=A0A848D362_ANEAE|nr:cytochrome aa3 quinol oxidase subunit III [Aneurinibacillus aneurinilyticus]ERI09073.1 cytochrome aa3 quinol oxidase, subunit III [Aneurinibacillus aneurinilyticus ATCC 12856]MCI1693345.1 cytochrome aa3 quinol oxidase subunit III [Aneurinibacillus aneurinilyticus]MED0671421.1 cytochrome aa3 quinol oxidase subunit III [Aneurinibacillus aneurinilyticus]MED0707523.1 cytochrome aa3 quinol oxidase subunit III [Aneurinibacillus aneurinilyticus]MED0723891.1 cytochrome aa3 quinol oxidase subunit II
MAAHVDPGYKGPLEYSTEESRMNILGFWIFLGAEFVLFSCLFAMYIILQGSTAGGPTPKELFEFKSMLIQTLLLLTSSFTCGLAIHEMRRGKSKGLAIWLIITLLLGLGFLYMEIEEFLLYVNHEGATWGTSAFLSSFFVLVGTHGAHVTLGSLWMIGIIIQVLQRGLTPRTTRKAFIIGLYWHFLDVMWVFIFTVVYLTGMVV